MVEESKDIQNEPQEEFNPLKLSIDLVSSMISEKQVEMAEGPEEFKKNGECVQKLSVKVFGMVDEI